MFFENIPAYRFLFRQAALMLKEVANLNLVPRRHFAVGRSYCGITRYLSPIDEEIEINVEYP